MENNCSLNKTYDMRIIRAKYHARKGSVRKSYFFLNKRNSQFLYIAKFFRNVSKREIQTSAIMHLSFVICSELLFDAFCLSFKKYSYYFLTYISFLLTIRILLNMLLRRSENLLFQIQLLSKSFLY